jgi:hypothetical protein
MDVSTGETSTTRDLEAGGKVTLGGTRLGLDFETHVTLAADGNSIPPGANPVKIETTVGAEGGGEIRLSEGPSVQFGATLGIVRFGLSSDLKALATTMARSPVVAHHLLTGRGVVTTADVVRATARTQSSP